VLATDIRTGAHQGSLADYPELEMDMWMSCIAGDMFAADRTCTYVLPAEKNMHACMFPI
jgi:hypothetical protein